MAVLRPERRSGDEGPDPSKAIAAPASTDPGADRDREPDRTERVVDAPTGGRPGWHVRLFGSPEFFRLWLVQVVSATGDWLGLAATIAFTTTLYQGEASSAAAVSAVVAVRLVPGFLFGPVVGVLVDRWDRKKTMIVADLSRAAILVCVPFVRNLAGLIVASLLLEVFSLLWNPSKEAIVPHLVPQEHLTTANSLSMGAAFGTAPLAQLLFALLAGISAWLAHTGAVGFLALNQTALAFFFDAATFLFAAGMIWRLDFPRRALRAEAPAAASRSVAWTQTFRELKEGWQYVFLNRTVRAVNLGLSVALIGGGMLIPLGAVFAATVLGAGAAGYGLFTTALMFGVAGGIVTVSALQRRLPQARTFTAGLFVAGLALFLAASTGRLAVSVVFVFVMGFATGPVYVLGFSMLHAEVEDELRGRVFGALDTLIRFCVLAGLVVGPLVATVLGEVSEAAVGGAITVGSASMAVPGVRLALWLDAAIIVGAGFIARQSFRSSRRLQETSVTSHPANLPSERP